jgi:hypothetical protein
MRTLGLAWWELFFNWLKSIWLPLAICLISFTIVKCFRIHSDNKLKGGGYKKDVFTQKNLNDSELCTLAIEALQLEDKGSTSEERRAAIDALRLKKEFLTKTECE